MSEVIVSFSAALFPLAVVAAIIGIVIYLIIQRMHEKDNETFEDRDN